MCPATTYIVLVELRDVCQVINQSQVVGHRLVCLLLFDLQLILPGVPIQPLLPLGVPGPEQAHYHLVIRLVRHSRKSMLTIYLYLKRYNYNLFLLLRHLLLVL